MPIKQLDDMDLLNQEWICPSGPVDADSAWEPEKNAFRPRILSRLNAFITCPDAAEQLPHLRAASIKLHAYLTKIWRDVSEIDLFAVFR